MALLSGSNLSKSFGSADIFSGVSLSVARGARIAIVGPNGIGKTTLLRILIGLDEPSAGSVQRARGISIGFLPQEADLSAPHSLWEECLSAFRDLRQREAELAGLEAAMADPEQAGQALERYGPLQHDFERLGGYTYETRIRQTLSGLGFDAADFPRPLTQLSGGQRTRALLARLLLSNPDLLVLDEPTNHLDIAAVEWLEGYLAAWEGTALIVSHDRYFLDRVVTGIWEMSRSGLESYPGNYTAYLGSRQLRWENRQRLFEDEKERLLKEVDYVKRNISGQRTLQAKGKLRRLSRQVEAIESLGVEAALSQNWGAVSAQADISTHPMGVEEVERRVRGLKPPARRPTQLKIALKAGGRSGNIVLRTVDLVVGYPGEALFETDDLELRRLETVAVIGPNGAGKTTFLKTILGLHPPLSGELILGAALDIGYFAQAHEELHPERSLVEEIDSVAPHLLLAEVRDYLARFLFTGDDVFRQVSTLSGGERGRLALAKLALSHNNVLLLDEPTNHLDIPSQEILQAVLAEYQGTILIVSHDRYLIDALGTQIWEIDAEGKRLHVFKGTYSEYRAFQEAARLAAEDRALSPVPSRGALSGEKRSRSAPSNGSERKRKARLAEVEARIARLEENLAALSLQLESPPPDPQRVQALGEDYVETQNEIDALLREWEGLH
jgi:ATP-binding cassette subfamily F protein 3